MLAEEFSLGVRFVWGSKPFGVLICIRLGQRQQWSELMIWHCSIDVWSRVAGTSAVQSTRERIGYYLISVPLSPLPIQPSPVPQPLPTSKKKAPEIRMEQI
jgi:hypothetical protein